jgi:hypothetical protein
MAERRWMNARTVVRLAAAGAFLWSCTSDTHSPSTSDVSQTRVALGRRHGGPSDGGADASGNLDENPTSPTLCSTPRGA